MIGERKICLTCNTKNMRRILQVNLLTFQETVNNILYSLVHNGLCLRSSPEENGAIFCPDNRSLSGLTRSSIVNPRHPWLQSRCAVINLTKHSLIVTGILAYGCCIPLATAEYTWQTALQHILARHLMRGRVLWIGCLDCTHYILTYV